MSKKLLETFLEEGSANYDSKKILNRSKRTIPEKVLHALEKGVSLEALGIFEKKNIPIFKYKTQITIHGNFPELRNNYLQGYKHIFQNKNGSIGIKWAAIDERKRLKLKEKLKCLGFYYYKNSSERIFIKNIVIGYRGDKSLESNLEKGLENLKSLYSKIDMNLCFGKKWIRAYEIFGRVYLELNLAINAIPRKNLNKFARKMGATKEAINELLAKERAIQEAREKEREEREAKKDDALEVFIKEFAEDINWIKSLNLTKEPLGKFITLRPRQMESGKYIPEYIVTYVYKTPQQKLPRWNSTHYKTREDALNHEFQTHRGDYIFKGKIDKGRYEFPL